MAEQTGYFDLQVNGYGGVDFNQDALTPDQLHRQEDGPRAAGTTDGDASAPRQSGRPCRRL